MARQHYPQSDIQPFSARTVAASPLVMVPNRCSNSAVPWPAPMWGFFSGHGLQLRGPVPALRDHPGEGATAERARLRAECRYAGLPSGVRAPGRHSAQRVTLAQITACMLPQGDTSRGFARDEVVTKGFVTALMPHPGSKRPDIA
jgi:hypothetical protein